MAPHFSPLQEGFYHNIPHCHYKMYILLNKSMYLWTWCTHLTLYGACLFNGSRKGVLDATEHDTVNFDNGECGHLIVIIQHIMYYDDLIMWFFLRSTHIHAKHQTVSIMCVCIDMI